jgi:amino acid adenylation domain-containing protein/non-ribosomal peptide synthase protein (TIGR01720 family)
MAAHNDAGTRDGDEASADQLLNIARTLSPERRELLALRLRKQKASDAPTQVIARLDRAGETSYFPVSFAQQRLWFLDQLLPNNPFYNLPTAVRLVGAVDITVLKQSLSAIAQRHETVRTTFRIKAGQPVQVIAPAQPLPVLVIDLQALPEAAREAATQRLITADAQQPFDLANGPLLRVILLRLKVDVHVLMLTMHHIISDDWSVGVFIRELFTFYAAYAAGRSAALPELPIQYADYAAWQRDMLRGEVLNEQLRYWRAQLADLAALTLPTDHPRPAVFTFQGTRQRFQIPAALSIELQLLSRQEKATLFMLLLAVFQVLLMRYSGQDDIVIGTPTANRTQDEIAGLIGFFVNQLVLRTDLSGKPTFRAALGRVRAACLGAYAHQDLPFEQVVEALAPDRDQGYQPLFQTLFELQHTTAAPQESLALALLPLTIASTTVKFDLSLSFVETEAGLVGLLDYSTDLFDATTIQRMRAHLQTLIAGVVAEPDRRIVDLPLLTKSERQQLLVDWNTTTTSYPHAIGLHQMFAAQAARTPDAVAVVCADHCLTYRSLNARADQLGALLRRLGVGPEVIVGLCVERSVEMVVGLLGVLKAGGAFLPLDAAYPASRLAYMLQDSRAGIVLLHAATLPIIQTLLQSHPHAIQSVVSLDHSLCPASFPTAISFYALGTLTTEPPVLKYPRADMAGLAYLMYTSGSTGQPKGVLIRHDNLVPFFLWYQQYFDLRADDRIIQYHSLSFDFSTWEIFETLLCGACLHVVPATTARDVEALAAYLSRAQITMLNMTPSQFSALINYVQQSYPAALAALRILVTGGEALPAALAQRAAQLLPPDCRLYNEYGPTETTISSAIFPITPAALARYAGLPSMPIGQPIGNTQLYLLDARLHPMPIGLPGDLYIGGAGLASGYFQQPALTAERFVPHIASASPGARMYKTGDRARRLADGMLEFLGRQDDQMKVRGYRIELGEIEAVLGQHPAVRAATVLAREDMPGDMRLVAYVVPAEDERRTTNDESAPSPSVLHPSSLVSELRAFLAARLPNYMLPAAFVLLAALPLTRNGKVDRKALPPPDRAQPGQGGMFDTPRTPLEELLSQIWTEVLHLEQLGIHDNFFALGGHSLIATQIISRVRETFQIELPLRALFEAPTVAGLAEHIAAARRHTPEVYVPPLVAVPREQALPLSFAQQRLWFIDQLQPNSPAYNIPAAVRLTGQLDLAALQRSLNDIVRRHEALRTTFVAVAGQPEQVIAPAQTVALTVLDLGALHAYERETAVYQLTMAEARRAFDLARGPLLRTTLLRVGTHEHVIVLILHHIIADGWSIGVFIRELGALYTGHAVGQPAALPALPIQYADYTIWQRQWLQGTTLDIQLAYWKEQLGGDLPVLDLPTDYPRPPIQAFRGGSQSFVLPPSLAAALRARGRQEDVTLFMLLLAVFQILLARYSGQAEIVVGTPIANRIRVETEGLIGFFANTLVLRTNLAGNVRCSSIFQRVREVCLAAYAHQDLPFEQLVEELQPVRDLSRNPLFQVMFVLQNTPIDTLDLPGLTMQPVPAENGTAKFDWWLSITDGTSGLFGVVEYNTDLFDAVTITRMLGHFQALLQQIAADPAQPVWGLLLASDAERQQLLVEWNDTRAAVGSQLPAARNGRSDARLPTPDAWPLNRLFEAQAARTPDAIAVAFERAQLTYHELNRRTNQLAHHLRGLGVGPEVLVGIYADRSLELVIGLLGVLKAGGAYLPLDPAFPHERLAFMLDDAQAPVLVLALQDDGRRTENEGADSAFVPRRSAFGAQQVVDLRADWPAIAQAPAHAPANAATADNLAYAIYTSGSTGAPKGAMNSHRGIGNRLLWMQETYQLTTDDRVLQKTPFSFDVSVWEFFWPLITGAQLVLARPQGHQDSAYLADLIARSQITTLHFVPAMLRVFLEEERLTECRCLRRIISSGEALPLDLQARCQARLGAALYNLYGPTEAAVDVTAWSCERTGARPAVPIGRPIANTQIYLLDRYLHPVPIGVPGEIHIGGVGLARGYLKRPALTAERFVPNPFSDCRLQIADCRVDDPTIGYRLSAIGYRLYRTGDVARYRADGVIEFLGRRDHQVKVRGIRIELGEIEATLRSHSAVREAIAIAREDAPGDRRLVAYVVPAAPDNWQEAQLSGTDLLAAQIADWQAVFDDTYQRSAAQPNPTFDIVGWNSSYTGQPIPEAEMREWLEQTVARIRALQPRRVLEIGCGTGLVLFQLAPECVHYCGTDFSPTVIQALTRQLALLEPALPQVTLLHQRADDFAGLTAGEFDTVILNSVIQYFPSIEHFLRVLEGVIGLVAPGGQIFLGDLRSLPLLEAFHTAVELNQSPSTRPTEQLKQQVQRRVAQENELIIDPAFFLVLKERLPQISHVEVQLKRGHYHNELTKFRYDVILHVGADVPPTVALQWHNWQQEELTVASVRQLLLTDEPAWLGVAQVPNARLYAEVGALAALAGPTQLATVGDVHDVLQASAPHPGVDPEALWSLSDELPYVVDISWSDSAGYYDVVFRHRSASGAAAGAVPAIGHAPKDVMPWHSYGNNPLQEKLAGVLTSTLRNYLKEKLPDYMVPAAFVLLQALPLTSSGKLDRRALPAPDTARPAMDAAFAAPRTPVEISLAAIWAAVLRRDPVGVHDNFFALGGDSILSIQIVARARQAGLQLTPQQLFQHQTIADLAAVVAPFAAPPAPARPVAGPLPLSPIQQQFFAHDRPDPQHDTQALLLALRQPVPAAQLAQVVAYLVAHHDALRLRFVQSERGWQAHTAPVAAPAPLARIDLRALPASRQPAVIAASAAALQRSLHLADGPLLRVAYFDAGAAQAGRLLLIIHHLAVDGVSWRILLEDVQTLCAQLARGAAPSLPPKTSAFHHWAERLVEYAQSAPVQQELPYWLSVLDHRIERLPIDYPAGANTYESAQSVVSELTIDETRALLQAVPAAYRTQINDVLLTALAQVLTDWVGTPAVLIDLEGHGREDLFADIDLTRTVGWFTTLYPIVLDVRAASEPGTALKTIKEQLRQVPNHGLGYGVLRYLAADPAITAQMRRLPQAEVLFNYLGQVDQAGPGAGLFGPARESSGPTQSLHSARSHLLEISGLVVGGRLQLGWSYSEQVHQRATIERLAQAYLAALRALIAHCLAPEAGGYTPSDFPLVRLDQPTLDRLTGQGRRIQDIYPLAPTQQGLLFHTLYDAGAGMYIEQLAYTLRGDLDIPTLQRAWQHVADRHPIFRTAFMWEAVNEPLQIVHEQSRLPWELGDWGALRAAERSSRLEAFLAEDRARGFDLSTAPLMRLALFQLEADAYQFAWTYHHLLLDGWSVPIIIQEVFAAYRAFIRGRAVQIARTRPYRAYIAWLQQQDPAQAETFWRQALKGFRAPTPLGVDHSGQAANAASYAERLGMFPELLADSLQAFARQHGLTLNTLFQGAWALLLSRYSGETDIVFGTVVSGRPPNLAGVETMVGLFINTLPVRTQATPSASLLPWLHQVQAQQVELRQYEYSPLAQIQGWSEVPGGQPLFESILVFENFPVEKIVAVQDGRPELRIEDARTVDWTNYPLTIGVMPKPALVLRMGYDRRRFDAATIARMYGHIQVLLNGIAARAEQRLADLPILTNAERQQLLVDWNATARAYPIATCVHELFAAQARRTPDAVALVYAGRSASDDRDTEQITYRELNARANQLAHHLQTIGVGREVPVGLCFHRSLDLVVGMLGILKAGGAFVPLDPAYPAERLAFMLQDAQAAVLVTHRRLLAQLPTHPARVVCLDSVWATTVERHAEDAVCTVRPDNLAYLIYTSGSTGQPKAVQVEHRQLVNTLCASLEQFAFHADDVVPCLAAPAFDIALFELFPPLLSGGRVLVLAQHDLIDLPYLLSVLAHCTVFHAVPSLMQQIVQAIRARADDRLAYAQLRLVLVGGERVPPALLPMLRQVFARAQLGVLYGPTEATIICTCYRVPRAGVGGRHPLGRPLANVQARLYDRQRQLVPIGVAGELYIGGAGVTRGYLRQEKLTQERYVVIEGQRWYRTGDQARYGADGVLEFMGRLDEQVKIRGYRIELGEVAAAVCRHPLVRECVVLDREDGPDRRRLVAYVVPTTDEQRALPFTSHPASLADELRTSLAAWLPDYMIPAAFVPLEALPLLPNGKIDRTALPAPASARTAMEPAFTAPRTPVEINLAAIWAAVLRRDPVGVHDNFFALGGDSILSIQIVARARQAGLQLTPQQLFQHQTIADLAAVVAPFAAPPAPARPVAGPLPLSPIQQQFFAHDRPDPQHDTQALLLALRRPVPAAQLAQVVAYLVAHHDALRLRFVQRANGWQAHTAPVGAPAPLARIDLRALPASRQSAVIAASAAALQRSLHLADGPLLRVAYFDAGAAQAGRLLLIIHHLAVDGVSWRILLEDVQTLCAQLARRAAPSLPPKTSAFHHWTERLVEYAQSAPVQQEQSYWLEQRRATSGRLPVDAAGGANTVASARPVAVALSADATRALLQAVPSVYRTQINDVLLTALAQVLTDWVGTPAVLIDLEGHGREDLFADIDLTRTVGWFTTLFPVLLDLGDADGAGDALKAIKEQLRRVPNHGIGYGLLRYLRADAEVARALRELPQAEISFNYLGQTDQVLAAEGAFGPAHESSGPTQSPRGSRSYLLEVSGIIVDDRLQLAWVYSEQVHHRSTIERLAQAYLAALHALIAHCLSPEAGGYTPSDFPLARLDQPRLDRLVGNDRQIEDIYPLSPMQQGMLFHTLYTADHGVYVAQLTCTIQGKLNVAAFQSAWRHVAERHPVFRTAFAWEGLDEPLQIVHSSASLPWTVEDWRERSLPEQEAGLAAFLKADRAQGFELTRAPLMRWALFAKGADSYQFVWSQHHMLLDGWSVPLVFKEVLISYAACTQGQEIPLARSRPYRAYIAWLQQQDLAQAEVFWRQTLNGFRAPTPLGVDRPAASVTHKATYAEQQIELGASAIAALQAFARSQSLTLNTLLQGAWALLLSRYSGERDVVFGAVVAGRPADLPGVETMVGLFINTVPIRVRTAPHAPLLAWLAEIQARQLDARQYEYSPLVQVQGWGDVPRGLPLFESLLVFENYPMEQATVTRESQPQLAIGDIQSLEQSNYPLAVIAVPGAELTLKIIFDEQRFDAAAIGRMLGHLRTLLAGMAAQPAPRLIDLPFLAPAEQQQLLVDWNTTATDYPYDQCIHHLFAAQVERAPDATAVVLETTHVTYQALNRRANQLAHQLRAIGVGPEVPVGVCLERSPELIEGVLGILKAGGIYLPLDPTYPAERLAFMIQDAQVSIVLTQKDIRDTLPIQPTHSICLDTQREALAHSCTASPASGVTPANLAYIIYTSGSTGVPKGVAVAHQGISNLAQAQQRAFAVQPASRVLQFAPLSFDASIWEIVMALLSGATLCLSARAARLPGVDLLQFLQAQAITHMTLPPSALAALPTEALPSVRTLVVAGEVCPADLVTRWAPQRRLWNAYGPSEVSVCATMAACADDGRPPPIGRPLDNTQVYVLDASLRPLPIGVMGELCIGGAGLARGYLGRPDLTAERFVPNPFSDCRLQIADCRLADPTISYRLSAIGYRLYRTGDLARYRPDGTLEFLGRRDDQVKLRGFRIELGEIAAALRQHPAIREVAVLAREDTPGAPRLVAYIVPTNDERRAANDAEGDSSLVVRPSPFVSELRAFLRSRLPDYMLPAAVVVLPQLPLTPSGKVDRRALPEPETVRPELDNAFAAPRDPVEAVLAMIWADILELDRVGIHDNFFELGGHSLLATRVISRVRETFQVALPLHRLFEAASVAALAAVILEDQSKRMNVERRAQLLLSLTQLPEEEVEAMLDHKTSSRRKAGGA